MKKFLLVALATLLATGLHAQCITIKSTPGPNTFTYWLHFFSDSTGFAAGTSGIKQTTNGGRTWASMSSAAGNFRAISWPDLQNGWAAGASGKIIKSTDGGLHG